MAREVCEISLVTDEPELQVQGRFVLENGKLTYELERADAAQMFQGLMLEDILLYNKASNSMLQVFAREQPALWFHSLPAHFAHSSYIAASMVGR